VLFAGPITIWIAFLILLMVVAPLLMLELEVVGLERG
jgi:hypothetical protein